MTESKSNTKKTLARKIAEDLDITYRLATSMVESVVEEITDQMKAGEVVSIDKIGKFRVDIRPARTGRNPKTGEALEVSEKKLAKFKVSSILKAKVQDAYAA